MTAWLQVLTLIALSGWMLNTNRATPKPWLRFCIGLAALLSWLIATQYVSVIIAGFFNAMVQGVEGTDLLARIWMVASGQIVFVVLSMGVSILFLRPMVKNWPKMQRTVALRANGLTFAILCGLPLLAPWRVLAGQEPAPLWLQIDPSPLWLPLIVFALVLSGRRWHRPLLWSALPAYAVMMVALSWPQSPPRFGPPAIDSPLLACRLGLIDFLCVR